MEAGTRLRVFISYRREDCLPHANLLASGLRHEAGVDVCLDVDSIPFGADFADYIEREVASCDVVVVMIGDDWLSVVDDGGAPRISDPLDWVRLEINSALKRDIPVIPVLVEGARMPRPAELPSDIARLAYRNAATLRDPTWNADLRGLVEGLSQLRPARYEGGSDSGSKTPGAGPSPRKPGTPLDKDAARAFIEAIPAGRWASYGDVASAGHSPKAGMAVGEWLRREGEEIANVWRVLQAKGSVSPGWSPERSDLPQTPEEVEALLRSEGVEFDKAGRAQADQRIRPTA